MSTITDQASQVEQLPKLMLYGGGAFSVGQWFAENANWIAATVGIVVTIAGFVLTYRASKRKEKRELEEHAANMALLAAELEKVRATKPSK